MQRKRPDYDPNALRENITHLDVNIARIQQAINNLQQRNEALRQSISKNEKDIWIFQTEIGKLKQQQVELQKLIVEIERGR